MLELNDKNFDFEVVKSSMPVLVDFWAAWCGPCHALAPIIEELAREYQSKPIKIAKLNVDEAGETASKYGVMSIPTLIFFKNGKVVDQMVGVQDKKKLQSTLNNLIST